MGVKRSRKATVAAWHAGHAMRMRADGLSEGARSRFRRLLRRYRRFTLLALVTAFFFALLWSLRGLLLPAPRARRRARNAVFRAWARVCLRVAGGRLRVEGPAPRAPFLLVCNHLGYVDVPVLAACTGAWFVAKMEIRGWPLVGVLCRSAGTLFIDRICRGTCCASTL